MLLPATEDFETQELGMQTLGVFAAQCSAFGVVRSKRTFHGGFRMRRVKPLLLHHYLSLLVGFTRLLTSSFGDEYFAVCPSSCQTLVHRSSQRRLTAVSLRFCHFSSRSEDGRIQLGPVETPTDLSGR